MIQILEMPRKLLVLIVFVVYLSFAMCRPAPTEIYKTSQKKNLQTKIASKRNPLLILLEKEGVMLHSRPIFGVNKCQPEWPLYGTYCDYESLKYAVQLDQADIERSTSKMIYYLNTFESELQGLKAVYEEVKKNATVWAKLGNQTSANFDSLFSVQPFDNLTMNDKFSQCWKEMSKLRSSSVCQICSGRNSNFSVSTNPIVLSDQTCSTTMSLCKDSMLILGRTSEIAHKFMNLFATLPLNKVVFRKQSETFARKAVNQNLQRLKIIFAKKTRLCLLALTSWELQTCIFPTSVGFAPSF